MRELEETLISQFIDNQLNLDEKIKFVENVKKDDKFYKETVEFLKVEKLLSFTPTYKGSLKNNYTTHRKKDKLSAFSRILPLVASILIVLSFALGFYNGKSLTQKTSKTMQTVSKQTEVTYRFVYYNPNAKSVALIGSFTNWKKIYLKRVGNSGYWQIYIKIPKGDIYKYNFVVNNKKIIYDPSNRAKIYNGFGGYDSILKV